LVSLAERMGGSGFHELAEGVVRFDKLLPRSLAIPLGG
jgi:hypothetical protein